MAVMSFGTMASDAVSAIFKMNPSGFVMRFGGSEKYDAKPSGASTWKSFEPWSSILTLAVRDG